MYRDEVLGCCINVMRSLNDEYAMDHHAPPIIEDLEAENARLREDLETVKYQLVVAKERRMKEDIASRDRIADLEAVLKNWLDADSLYHAPPRLNETTLSRLRANLQDAKEKARAVLHTNGSQAAPTVAIRPEVTWFAEQMERKLRENDHKGGWRNDDIGHLNHRLGLEQVELNVALTKGVAEEIISEAADVANFAMMVADLAHDPPKNYLHEYIRSQAAPEEGEDGD